MRFYNKDAGFDVSLTILLPIFFLTASIVLALIIIFVVQYRKKSRLNRPNLMFLELDLKQWRIKKIPLAWNQMIFKSQFNQYLDEIISNGWVDINTFFHILGSKEEQKWKKAIEYCIKNKANIEINSILALDNYDWEKSYWNVEFFSPHNDLIRINVKWINRLSTRKIKLKLIDKEELLLIPEQFKLFYLQK